jgi:acetoacetyl-CoA synthetase
MAHKLATPRIAEGALLWELSAAARARSNMGRYLQWLAEERSREFAGYDDLWRWSVSDSAGFWSSLWDFFQIRAHRRYTEVLADPYMPGARWFEGAELNYAEHALRRADDHPAVIAGSETRPSVRMTYKELCRQTAAVAAALRRMGVGRGDRVVAYLPNIPEALVAFLATASLGAIWASCPPEFGLRSVVDRFRPIEPRVLFAVDGYRFKGQSYDRRAEVRQLRASLPTVEHLVLVPYLEEQRAWDGTPDGMQWSDLAAGDDALRFTPVPFAHPLWILYSSGTTGPPKAIVHGHGGILLEHLKALALHLDLTEADRFFWYTTTGWMMWNFLVSGLLLGSTLLLYDGHPGHPDLRALWRFAHETRMTYFGTSAPHIHACMRAGIEPGREFELGSIRGIGSTGAPLTPEGFQWIYEKVHPHLLLNSFSGGTDLCTGIVGACPLLPVRAGEIPGRLLGAPVEAYDGQGRSVVDQVGELVLTRPMPSMPVCFWNDPGNRRYRESYFETFPGVWRHGDWIKVTSQGSCVITGRSDSTLNRGGVRMGTSEFYRVIEELPGVTDSLVIDTGELGREGALLMFVVLAPGLRLDEGLRARLNDALRRQLSPRHVPDQIHVVGEVPYTLNGKKVEVPVKRILMGTPPETAISRDAVRNPESLRYFAELAERWRTGGGPSPAPGLPPA